MPRIDAFLKIMQQADASDLHVGDGYSPMLRIHGALEPTKHRILSADEVRILIYEMLADQQIRDLENTGEIDFTYSLPEVARFRINIYKSTRARGRLPHHPNKVPTLDGLGFPDRSRSCCPRDRPDPGHGPDELGQDDHAGGDGRPPERDEEHTSSRSRIRSSSSTRTRTA